MKLGALFGLLFFSTILNSCSTLKAISSNPSAKYRRHVDSRLRSAQLYEQGKLLVSAKVIRADEDLKTVQENYTPGFSFKKKPEYQQFIVGLSLAHPGAFLTSEIQFLWGDQKPKEVNEIYSSPQIESLYYFAHPFQRVFLVNYSESRSEGALLIKTPRGQVQVELGP